MKKLLLLMLVAVFTQFNGNSQSCLPQGIRFYKQSDIDNFKSNYPGCTEIGGDVIIEEHELISNLDGLSNLYSIGGNLRITRNVNLDNLLGLANLSYVGGNLEICYNESIATLDGLESLAAIGGNLRINANYSLKDLGGLRKLNSIHGSLEIKWNNVLTVLSGLDNIEAGTIKNLTIANNQTLSTCEVQSICDYLADPQGKVDIYSNMTGCNNPPEIARTGGFDLPCLPYGNYYFFTQDEVDHFQTDYPGCTNMKGSLTISGNLIDDLGGLSEVTKIKGDLIINEAGNLRSLDGLGGLDSIRGNFIIESSALNELAGMDDLVFISGSVTVMYNSWITSVSGLNNVKSLGNDLRICYNENLTEISGFHNLDYLKGNLEIVQNDNLVDISGLNQLDSVRGNVCFAENTGLSSLSGLDNLKLVRGSLSVGWSQLLQDLRGLGSLSSLGGNLIIEGNPSLKSFSGLDKLTKIGSGVMVSNNVELASFSGLHNVQKISGDMIIGDGNNALNNLSGFDNLKTIGGNFMVLNNEGLSDLDGLDALISIGGGLNIDGNESLTSLKGLEKLSKLNGELAIRNNPMLTSLLALRSVQEGSISDLDIYNNSELAVCEAEGICTYLANPSGVIEIYNNKTGCNNAGEIASACGASPACLPFGNYYLVSQAEIDNFQYNYPQCTDLNGLVFIGGEDIVDLQGLSTVKSIHGDLVINGNKDLYDFAGLTHLELITGKLNIINNKFLTSLQGLENIDGASLSQLFIYHNPSLTDCAIESVCDYISIPGSYCYINVNGPGCQSKQQVAENCAFTFVEEQSTGAEVMIYPNPAKSQIVVEVTEVPDNLCIRFYNNAGQEIYNIQLQEARTEIDISALPAGIYCYKIYSAGNMLSEVGKIVKM
jgi:hypothetical protein